MRIRRLLLSSSKLTFQTVVDKIQPDSRYTIYFSAFLSVFLFLPLQTRYCIPPSISHSRVYLLGWTSPHHDCADQVYLVCPSLCPHNTSRLSDSAEYITEISAMSRLAIKQNQTFLCTVTFPIPIGTFSQLNYGPKLVCRALSSVRDD